MSKPKKISTNHTKGSHRVKIADLVIGSRIRDRSGGEEETRRYIENELAPDIAENGCIHPPCCWQRPDGRIELIAGWCRTEAYKYLGVEEIEINLRPALEDLTPDRLRALELAENIRRRNHRWQDKAITIYEIHALQEKAASTSLKKWSQAATGEMLGYSGAHVGDAIIVAKALLKTDEEIRNAKTFDEAQKILSKRKEDEMLAEMQRRQNAMPKPKKRKAEPNTPSAPQSQPTNGKPSPSPASVSRISIPASAIAPPKPATGQTPPVQIPISDYLFHSSWEALIPTLDQESVDLSYTDIPFAIDTDDFEERESMQGQQNIIDSHTIAENKAQMWPFLKAIYGLLKPDAYHIFWYDISLQEYLCDGGREAGFDVMPYPLLWLKPSMKTKAAHKYWPKACEYVMVMTKGKVTKRELQSRNWFEADGAAERRMQNNPFAKPFAWSKWLLDQVMHPGMTVADLYAGGGSLVRAVANCGGIPLACEKDEKQFPELVEKVKDVYTKIHHGKCEFV